MASERETEEIEQKKDVMERKIQNCRTKELKKETKYFFLLRFVFCLKFEQFYCLHAFVLIDVCMCIAVQKRRGKPFFPFVFWIEAHFIMIKLRLTMAAYIYNITEHRHHHISLSLILFFLLAACHHVFATVAGVPFSQTIQHKIRDRNF